MAKPTSKTDALQARLMMKKNGAKLSTDKDWRNQTVITPFFPPADKRKAGRNGLVSMAHLAAANGDNDKLESLLDAGFAINEISGLCHSRFSRLIVLDSQAGGP